MNSPLFSAAASTAFRLDTMAAIVAGGADVREFLQGQLSADLKHLSADRICPASCNSPQGRVQAVTWLVQRTDAVVLLLPATMVETTIARLRKYVLRSKVKLEPGDDRLVLHAVERRNLPQELQPGSARAHIERDGVSAIAWPAQQDRVLLLAPAQCSERTDPAAEAAWHLADIRAGLPQVYPQTHETFVAQMLNLDLLGGISYEKGCYTGQEIIARTHYRGSVKRRMFRFRASCPPPEPGTRVLTDGKHAGELADAAATADGCELLAVVSLGQIESTLTLDGAPAVALERLEMPYEVMSDG